MELLVVISIIAFMAVVSVPAFAQYGRSSDFKQKSDEVKMLMQRTYLLSRSPENTSVQAYRLVVEHQTFKLQKTDNNATWTPVSQIEKLDNGSANSSKNLENIQCDNPAGSVGCIILTCPTNPEEKCNIDVNAVFPISTLSAITLIDNKISGFNNLATYNFEGVTNNSTSQPNAYKPSKPFNVILTYSKQ